MAGSDEQVSLAEWLHETTADQTAGAGMCWEEMAKTIAATSQEAATARREMAEAEARGREIALQITAAEARIATLRAEALEADTQAALAKQRCAALTAATACLSFEWDALTRREIAEAPQQ